MHFVDDIHMIAVRPELETDKENIYKYDVYYCWQLQVLDVYKKSFFKQCFADID